MRLDDWFQKQQANYLFMMDETPGSQRAESCWNVGIQFHGWLRSAASDSEEVPRWWGKQGGGWAHLFLPMYVWGSHAVWVAILSYLTSSRSIRDPVLINKVKKTQGWLLTFTDMLMNKHTLLYTYTNSYMYTSTHTLTRKQRKGNSETDLALIHSSQMTAHSLSWNLGSKLARPVWKFSGVHSLL